jgi:trk system potassium uptake protein TrkA
MNIIIAGAGKVGFNLAKTLSIRHHITIIDKNSEALHRIQENLDVLTICGDLEDSNIYQNFIEKEIDLFIAVADIDNVNLIATLMADAVLHINRKIIRLQKHIFAEDIIKDKLDIDKIIFPTKLSSAAVASLLNYPKANNVKFFKYTENKLISIRVSKNITPFRLSTSSPFTIAGIERDKRFFIPQNEIQIEPNDLIYLFGKEDDIRHICTELEPDNTSEIQCCVVFGGEGLGISIAKALLEIDRDVKLVEKNIALCEKADEALAGKASVINSKYSTDDIFEEEGLDQADIFIAATNNDEYNIIKCLEAKEKGISKVVAINNEMEYYNLMHALGIIVVRGPKMSAYNKIMEEIGSTGVVIQKSFCGAKATVFMRKIFPNSKLINGIIKPIQVENSTIYYIRDDKIYPFTEKIALQEDDLILAFCVEKENQKVKQWIYEL